MKNIIHIYGAAGSGTTTLGTYLSEHLGYSFMDTDDYFWLPTDPKYTMKRPAAERVEMIKADIEKADHVIISGSLSGWGDELIPLFTLTIRIEIDKELRMERLRKREKQNYGSRIEPGGDMYQHHLEFIEWAMLYDTGGIEVRSKIMHDEWQKLLLCRQIVVDGADSLSHNLNVIMAIPSS